MMLLLLRAVVVCCLHPGRYLLCYWCPLHAAADNSRIVDWDRLDIPHIVEAVVLEALHSCGCTVRFGT